MSFVVCNCVACMSSSVSVAVLFMCVCDVCQCFVSLLMVKSEHCAWW